MNALLKEEMSLSALLLTYKAFPEYGIECIPSL